MWNLCIKQGKISYFIKRKKHQSLIVNETISKHVDNENNSEENKEEPIYNKYLLNIYDEEIMNDKSIKYYDYVLLLKELELIFSLSPVELLLLEEDFLL